MERAENVSSTSRGFGRTPIRAGRNSRDETDDSSPHTRSFTTSRSRSFTTSRSRSVTRSRSRSRYTENRPERQGRRSRSDDRRDEQPGCRRQMSLEETIEAARNIGFREGVLHGQHCRQCCHYMQTITHICHPNDENYQEIGDQETGYFYYPQEYFYYPEGYYGHPGYH